MGAEEEKDVVEESKEKKVISEFDRENEYIPYSFVMHNNGPKFEKVELVGSFTDWKGKIPMTFDTITN